MRLIFADSVLDLDTRRLQRGGRDVHLPPKTFQLLEILIRQRPRVVTKGELDELLWPKTYVARSSLSRLIAELRAALGDGARDAKIIRTVHAVGYAFCAPLAPGTASARKQAAITLQWGERTFPLDEGEYVLGRDEGCRVVIDAEGVSRRHARVTVCGNAASIEDLGSKNGTYVNRERISAAATLRNGDEVALGKAVLMLRSVSDAGATRTVQMP